MIGILILPGSHPFNTLPSIFRIHSISCLLVINVSLCLLYNSLETFFVNISALLSFKFTKIIFKNPLSTYYLTKLYLASMCFVRAVAVAFSAIKIAPTLSQYMMIGSSISIPIASRIMATNFTSFAASLIP
jgi:hypothetical protein